MTSTGPKSTHCPPHVYSAPLKCFVVHSVKRCPISKSFFNQSREDRVPRFWNNSTDNDYIIADPVVLGVGVCFGAIHCIAWHFSFLTHTELLIWRVSSVAITTIPFYIPLTFGLAISLNNMNKFNTAAGIIASIAILSLFPAGLLYILARVFTLVLAFTSLRELPPGAFDLHTSYIAYIYASVIYLWLASHSPNVRTHVSPTRYPLLRTTTPP